MNPNSTKDHNIAKAKYENAEGRINEEREKDVRLRLAKAAWESLGLGTNPDADTGGDSVSLSELVDPDDFDKDIDNTDSETKLNERERIATEEMRDLIWQNYAESGR